MSRRRALASHCNPTLGAVYRAEAAADEDDGDTLRTPQPSSSVYFAYSPTLAQVKIGYTAGKPARRVQAIRWKQVRDLEYLGSVPGSQSLERNYHRRWSDYNRGGEWFSTEILPEIQAILASEI